MKKKNYKITDSLYINIKICIEIDCTTFGLCRFGRKFTMVFSAVLSATISIIQSFSTNYVVFLVLELMSSTVSSGMYAATFVLGMNISYVLIICCKLSFNTVQQQKLVQFNKKKIVFAFHKIWTHFVVVIKWSDLLLTLTFTTIERHKLRLFIK